MKDKMYSVCCHGKIAVGQYPDVCLPKKGDKRGQSVEAEWFSFAHAHCSIREKRSAQNGAWTSSWVAQSDQLKALTAAKLKPEE